MHPSPVACRVLSQIVGECPAINLSFFFTPNFRLRATLACKASKKEKTVYASEKTTPSTFRSPDLVKPVVGNGVLKSISVSTVAHFPTNSFAKQIKHMQKREVTLILADKGGANSHQP